MDIIIRQAKIVDPSSPFHLKQTDIFIQNGFIAEVSDNLDIKSDKEVKHDGLHISSGWVDIFSHFCDPGYEHKETLETGALAAVAGGYTDVLLIPNTSPALHNKSAIEYIVQKGKSLPVNIHPIAAISKNTEGKELAEMYDMEASGAVAFSDGVNSIQSAGLLLKTLQYLKAINKTVIQLPDDKSLNANGLMHEGVISTQLGLPGKAAIAEELMIARDIELVKYSNSRIHFTGISTKKSVELIAKAKSENLPITCSVTPYHLFFSDEDLTSYDTNLKVNPPLRTSEDREALRNAVLDGVIDCIASHHIPQDTDNKIVEFEYAKDGMIGLQTAFPIVRTIFPELSLERLIELFSINPAKMFNLPHYDIKPNEKACLTLFAPDEPFTLTSANILSKSKNTPFIDQKLMGKPLGVINKDLLFLPKELLKENQ